ncbi:MAG: cyclodeaminase/cyclohydrolase family protein, partial [Candidatus Acidiferrales bacterium]
ASLAGAAMPDGPGKLASLAQPFLDAVAEPTATPGGGSVAALAGALGASLGQMVAGLSRKKKSQAAYVDRLSEALAGFQAASRALAEAIDRDSASFEQVMAAYKLPKETSEQERNRDAAIQQALHGAADVPLEVARQAADVFDRLGQLEPISSPSMYSDIRVGRLMAAAAVRGALENVAINLESITDSAFASRLRSESASLAARVAESPVIVGR